MAFPWVSLLMTVPWSKVIANAPEAAESAKRLWNSVAGKTPPPKAAPVSPAAEYMSEAEVLGQMQMEIDTLKAANVGLQKHMVESSKLITTLADQNAELVKRIEGHRIRLVWLSRGLALALLALVYFAIAFVR